MATKILQIPVSRKTSALLKPCRYKGLHGGRGGSKSHFFARQMIKEMVANPNLRCICIREFQSSIKNSVKLLLEDIIEELGVGNYFQVQQSVIKSSKGNGEIVFQGTPEKMTKIKDNHTAKYLKEEF